ncbi:MAG: flagellar motor switch protein FliN [Terriglobia bacterium]|nr:flagellar motor switch protein FliN [Terriglobia bacterium]
MIENREIRAVLATSGGLNGELMVEFSHKIAHELALALLGPEAQVAEAEEREALTELLRQVCGTAATALRPRFSEVSFAVALEDPKWTPQAFASLVLEKPEWSGAARLCFSEELLAGMRDLVIETDRPALEGAQSSGNLDLLMDVQLGVRLRFGSRRMRLREILELQPGSVVELDRQVQEPVDLLVDKKLIGRGEVVVVDGRYGLRVGEVVTARERVESLRKDPR